MVLKARAGEGVPQARDVEAMLALEVWAHRLYLTALGPTR